MGDEGQKRRTPASPDTNVKRKPRKTTYFFNPKNQLTHNLGTKTVKSNDNDTIQASTIIHGSTTVGNETTGVIQYAINDDKSPSKPHHEPEYEATINQSSDDSFEGIGIKWKKSPRHPKLTPRKSTQTPSSSPLRNILDQNVDNSITVINEQAELMLEKYGSGFNNILSQTPRVNKTTSDISCHNISMPPSLVRAKSLGVIGNTVNQQQPHKQDINHKNGKSNGNRLKNWLHRLDFNLLEKKDVDGSVTHDHNNKNNNNNKVESMDLDKSMETIDPPDLPASPPNIGLKSSPVKFKEPMIKDTITESIKQPIKKPISSDPFSDDEEFIASFAPKSAGNSINKVTSSPPSNPISNSVKNQHSELTQDLDEFDEFDISSHLEHVGFITKYSDDIKELAGVKDEFQTPVTTKLSYTRPDLRRFQIINFLKTSYKTQGNTRNQLILTVKNNDNIESKLVLRGEYTTLNFSKDDIINIVITDPDNPQLIDDNKNILIWNPDVLVSATTVSQQLSCPRKSVLNDRFQFPGETSLPILIGVILHEIFQSCFFVDDWSLQRMFDLADELVNHYRLSFYSLGEGKLQEGLQSIKETIPYLPEWFNKYYQHKANKKNQLLVIGTRDQVNFSINKALDIEENIWSPIFGIKGKVDVTVEANIQGQGKHGNYLLPLEFKTGREYISHHAQSSLYSLLFKDRYNLDVNSFLLVYTKEKIMKLGNIRNPDLRSLINLRNRISEYLMEGIRNLPPVIKTSSICERCDIQLACMTLHLLVENGTPESSGLPEIFNDCNGNIINNQLYKDFYEYWDLLITKEEQLMKSLKKDLWIMSSTERELNNGKALSNLVITDIKESNSMEESSQSKNNSDIYKFIYTLKRAESSTINQSFQGTQFTTHDRIMVSDEQGHFTIANGFITSIRPSRITISVDRRIINSTVELQNFNKVNNQTYESVLHKNSKLNKVNYDSQITYRLDKDEMFHGMGLARYNLLNLFMPDGDSKRRGQIIDLNQPKFNNELLYSTLKTTETKRNFNLDQKAAFDKIISSDDYTLILGMPGTGKTTLIASVINFLVSQGKSILLASYTHSAVDNILIKVKEYNVDILRIGHESRVHKDIKQFVPSKEKIKTFEDFESFYLTPSVVGVTCLGINDFVFNIRPNFDYCIIDEASQVSLPVSLGPIRFSDKFILVGDHHQLPPLVKHSHPKVKNGLQKSLFQYLNDNIPESVSELTYQYRMCNDIMKLSNEIVYDNRLKCGNKEVANQRLYIPNPANYKSLITGERDSWMQWIINPENRVIFLDHDLVPGHEINFGEKIQNPVEALLIWQIVESLTLCGVKENDIGIMSLYRAQLSILTKQFLSKPNIECMTADQFQGRDKECVIISLVRSNREGKVGELLQDWRRINVAVTRSKSKLIILGSKNTLSNSPVFKKFIDLVMKEKWMYRLPPNATNFYKQYDSIIEDGVNSTISNYSQSPTSLNKSQKRTQSGLKVHSINRNSKVVNNSPLLNDIMNELKD